MKKRTQSFVVRISIRVEMVRLVKVKAYLRRRSGKIDRVKSHYRKY